MRLNKRILTDEGEFELIVIRWDELEKCTTSNVLSEGIRRKYLVPTEKQTNLIRRVLNTHDAENLAHVWILVSLRKCTETLPYMGVSFPYTASIVSGILYDTEGSGVPAFGRNPNYEWEPNVGFVFLVRG